MTYATETPVPNWFAGGVNFECTACGACCTAPGNQVGSDGAAYLQGGDSPTGEAAAIATFLHIPLADFIVRYTFTTPLGRLALRLVYADGPSHPPAPSPDDGLTADELYDREFARTGDAQAADRHANDVCMRRMQGPGITACVFYDATTKLCKVHDVKPDQCRNTQFWTEHTGTREQWEAWGRKCEGVGRGPLVTEAELLSRIKSRFEDEAAGEPFKPFNPSDCHQD